MSGKNWQACCHLNNWWGIVPGSIPASPVYGEYGLPQAVCNPCWGWRQRWAKWFALMESESQGIERKNKTRLQLLFAAIACNVKRFIRHGLLYGYVTSGGAKIIAASSFSRIKMVFRSICFAFLRLKYHFLTKNCAILIFQRTKLQNLSILINCGYSTESYISSEEKQFL